MGLDPVTTTAIKSGASLLVKPTVAFLLAQYKRRGAAFANIDALNGAEPELDEAIAVLRGTAETLPAAILTKLKGFLSARPESFSNPSARTFLDDDRVVALVKSGARRILRGEDISDERTAARILHAERFDDDGIYGEALIEDATAFAAMTLLGHLTPGDRQTLELLDQLRDEMHGRFDQLANQIGDLQRGPDLADIEPAPLDAAIRHEVIKLRRQRMIMIADLPERALALGRRIETGLHLADPVVRAEAFREVATVLIRAERVDDAEPWLQRAEALGADVACERARIAMVAKDYDLAMRLLRDRSELLARGLLLDAIAKGDSDEASLAYFEANLAPELLTGHAVQVVSVRLLHAGRKSDALELLEQASTAQIDENPLLLYARARHKISQAVAPDVAQRIIEHDGMVPRPTDLHQHATGKRLLSEARSDLQRLEPYLAELGADAFAELVDINLIFLGLCASDPTERELARRSFVERLNDPKETALLAPLATLYDVDVDWSGLKASLAQAEKLGGYNDDQIRAAFALVMHEREPTAIAEFVRQYRTVLDTYTSNGSVVAVQIEATAKAGRIDEAKALLEHERGGLGADECQFLDATLAEVEGSDPIPMRLAHYETSKATHDLLILTEAMREKRDPRLGEYLIELWRRRAQISDAQDACDILISIGEEARVEEFVLELGDDARSDPGLHVHLAWVRFRRGELELAESELDALAARGIDNSNTRQLSVLIAVETGRWADLQRFVRTQLDQSADRSAIDLMSAAKIAQAIGSPITMDLLRAAVRKDATNPAICLQGYTIAVEAGLERSGEVGGWFATAISGGQESGLVQTKDLGEVITHIQDSRAEADRLGGLINRADVPMFIALGAMGATQSALIIRQMTENALQTDSRRRSVVPLYAGNRIAPAGAEPKSVSFDPLAILVLDYLGLLETALGSFDDIVLPSGTLHSFFEDRSKASHSQPSRVAQARSIKECFISGILSAENLAVNEGAGQTVDPEFLGLFAAAEERDGYVIDTSPLHPPGRLDEVVSPTPYQARLLSPSGLVASLLSLGLISQATARSASAQVKGSGDAWPDEPVPEPNRPMFLSTLAVQYLCDAGLFQNLKAHSGSLIVSTEAIDFADREISAGLAADQIRTGIDRIRDVLARAIASKKARIGPSRRSREDIERDGDGSTNNANRTNGPVMSVLRDTAGIDAFICDDRGMNKYGQVTDRLGNSLNFLTTTDLLGLLHRWEILNEAAFDEAKEKLRRGGAGLMPVDPEEMARAALASNWTVGPNAELRAIRDSIHLPLARRVIQLPNERPWFKTVSLAIAYAVRSVWISVADVAEAERAASYLFDMIPDPAAWSAGDQSPDREAWVLDVSRHTLWGLASIFSVAESHSERYRHWFANRVGPKYEKRDPGALDAVARSLYAFMASPMPEDEDDGG